MPLNRSVCTVGAMELVCGEWRCNEIDNKKNVDIAQTQTTGSTSWGYVGQICTDKVQLIAQCRRSLVDE